jgi:ABC-2 type transport system permease protein
MSSAEIAGFIGMILSLFIYMFILSYGGMVMSSVVEEKANRIVEVMVSSIKPWQLMAGKMIGTALVGLFQFLIWGLMITSLFMIATGLLGISQSPATAMPSGMDAGQIQSIVGQDSGLEFLQVLQGMPIAEIIVLFVLYFIGGYLLFASIFSAIGASVNEQEDTQQFMMPVILIFIFALYAGMFSMQNPDGPLAIWCSYIPFTSPIVMMVRIPFQIPLWQIALSLLILYGSAIAILLLSSKIYRVGILMYGKKPTFRDMIRWLRFK